MRQISCVLLVCVNLMVLHSQELVTPLSLICSGGSIGEVSIQSELRTVEWSLGEVIIHSGQLGSSYVTQGEQQGFPNDFGVGISEDAFSEMVIYPNPASRFVTLDQMPEGHKNIYLQSYLGFPIAVFSTNDSSFTFSTSHYSSGLYFLMVRLENYHIKTIKITIVHP